MKEKRSTTIIRMPLEWDAANGRGDMQQSTAIIRMPLEWDAVNVREYMQ